MDIKAEKRALRRAVIARILAMEPEDRSRQESILAGLLPGLTGFAEAETVLLYATAFPEEIDTGPLLREALGRGKALICPRVDREARRLRLFRVNDPDADLAPGVLGIPEPTAACPEVAPDRVDWALVPGLAFDRRGYRLGRGAGHYDRLLPTLRPDVPRWALLLEPQWVDHLPTESHDQPLDGLASPSTIARPRRPPQPSR